MRSFPVIILSLAAALSLAACGKPTPTGASAVAGSPSGSCASAS